jgi:membrane-associated phospholipid phosphatase
MSWLQSLDGAGFRFINDTLSNPVLDVVMPFFSGNRWFVPAVVVIAGLLLWKGGRRGRLYLILLGLTILLGEALVIQQLKDLFDRPRPFAALPDVHLLAGKGDHGSMPSGHSANWFAGTVVTFLFYRRSVWFMLPIACLVALSRPYVGVHYPSDIIVGGLLGAGYAWAIAHGAQALWRWAGQRWFPLWWERLPVLLRPQQRGESKVSDQSGRSDVPFAPGLPSLDTHWLRFGYIVIAVLLIGRLAYLAGGKIELSEDEAYQWLWSKHPALSYYSKPPLIAYTQWLGTHLWGDTMFGVRFFSPVIAATLGFLVLRFLAREVNARLGFWLVLSVTATPLLAVGSTLITIDPLSVLFWTAAMLSGWRAVQFDSTRHWLWTGLWMGLGFLSKYTALFQLLCWAVFFALWKAARAQLRRRGPWLSVLILALCTLPVVIWNAQHGWITVTHLEDRAGLSQVWRPTLRFFFDFVRAETLLLNPVFFVGAAWAAIAFWRQRERGPLLVYLFSMGAPLFLVYLLYTFRARVQPNWIAPAVLPLFCLMAIYWHARWRGGAQWGQGALRAGLIFGLLAVGVLHETNFIGRFTGYYLPAKYDPLRRVRGWSEAARLVEDARAKLLTEGKPVFVIGDHYGICGLLSFYIPEAREGVPAKRLVYFLSSDRPVNQFYFWPGYGARKGENAIFVQQRRLGGPPPERLKNEFATVKDLGIVQAKYRGRVFHELQLFECRELR